MSNKINPQRLSRIITSRECVSTTDYLINMYDKLSPETRSQIKELLENNKKNYRYDLCKMSERKINNRFSIS